MADTLSKRARSERMSRVRGKNTKVEHTVRSLVLGLGYRYRLHVNDLPGKPDLLFRSRRKLIFIHGCFWHRHRQCKLARLPKSRLKFWLPKLEGNRQRDKKVQRLLTKLGWYYMVIWECQLDNPVRLADKIKAFLDGKGSKNERC